MYKYISYMYMMSVYTYMTSYICEICYALLSSKQTLSISRQGLQLAELKFVFTCCWGQKGWNIVTRLRGHSPYSNILGLATHPSKPIKGAKLIVASRRRFLQCDHIGKRDRDPVSSPVHLQEFLTGGWGLTSKRWALGAVSQGMVSCPPLSPQSLPKGSSDKF